MRRGNAGQIGPYRAPTSGIVSVDEAQQYKSGGISYAVTALIVGGGGGGFSLNFGSGAGGGGVQTVGAVLSKGTRYAISVGAGGALDTNGSDSSAFGITSVGGGYGGGQFGGDGGSGGGSMFRQSFGGVAGTGVAGQGFAGGYGFDGVNVSTNGGGGGGASAVGGTTFTNPPGGNGGDGLWSAIDGVGAYYGGGGMGGASGGGASNGRGGGGGTPNTGGGGQYQQTGASGVVILRIPTSEYSGIHTGSPTVTTFGIYTIVKFTATGTYTA